MNIIQFVFILLLVLDPDNKTATVELSNTIQGKVIAIRDGDTIEILFNGKPLTIRLAHIDCPELKKSQPFGKAAKQFTSAMCFGQEVTILNEKKFDRYKRLIGIVVNNKGQNVNKELLTAGLAWHFKKYSTNKEYAELENTARANHIGLWADKNPVPPWEWRARKKLP